VAAGRLVEIWRYPVKSMRGERLEVAEVDARGVGGDRAWAVVDLGSQKALSAKREARLLEASAAWQDGRVEIALPGGGRLTAGEPEADAAVGEWLGRAVAVRRPRPGESVAFEMDLDPDDPEEAVDLHTPPGSWFDSTAPLHLLTTASLRAAGRLHPEGVWAPPRFRPNLVVDLEAEGFAEDAWVGAEIRVGALRARGRRPTTRCVLTTRAQPGLPRDPRILRSLGVRDACLGIYLDVLRPATVRAGDLVEPLG